MLTFLGRCEQTCPMQCPLNGDEESSQVAEAEGLPCPSGTLTSQAAVGQVEMGPSRTALRLSVLNTYCSHLQCAEYKWKACSTLTRSPHFPCLAFSFLGCLKAYWTLRLFLLLWSLLPPAQPPETVLSNSTASV